MANGSIKPQIGSNSYRDKLKGDYYSFSADGAFAFSNHFGVGCYWSNLNNRRLTEEPNAESSAETGGFYNGTKYDLSLIYFKNIRNGEVLEFSGGFGKGKMDRVSPSFPFRDYRLDYNSYFLQCAYSYHSPNLRNTIGVKIFVNDYYAINTSDTFRNLKYGYTLAPLQNAPVLYSRFFLNSEAYYKFIGFNAQIGCTLQPSKQLLADIPFYLSAGISLRMDNTLFKKSNTTKHEKL